MTRELYYRCPRCNRVVMVAVPPDRLDYSGYVVVCPACRETWADRFLRWLWRGKC